ncbi:ATP-binding protein [Pelotomaculum propionicicum]|uniref:ATP-binding protein n=1 Tax=Pelotomaculum propionicicum TaxID=258475 RepID=UPI003B81D636
MVYEEMTNHQLKEQLVLLRNQLDKTLTDFEIQKSILDQAEEALINTDILFRCSEEALTVSENRRISEHNSSEEALRLSNELYKHTNQALILSEERRIKSKKHDENLIRLSEELRKKAEDALKISEDLLHEANENIANFKNKFLRLDQLDLVGQLAAGIGHEIRNPMTTVKGFLQLFKEKERYNQDKDHLDLMIEELDRVNLIITEFLNLAKNKAVELKIQSLNKKIRTIFPMLQADAMKQDKDIRLELGEIPHIKIDKNEIKQLILNIVRNGLEAMSPGGTIIIRTYSDENAVVLSVQDNGKGIDSDVLTLIGTPFLTTKDTGTGLGLAVCYSIASRHNAKIDIETGSEGTTFFIRFKETA